MSFRKSFFKNVIILGGYSYLTQFLSLLSSVVLSRLLLPSEYGFVALITVFTGFIATFADAGLSLLIIRSDYNRLFHKSINFLSFIIGIILCLIVVALAYPIALFYKNNALILPTLVLSLNFVIGSLTAVPFGILSKRLRFNKMGQIELIRGIFEIIIMIVLAYFKFSYWSLVIAPIIAGLVRVFLYNRNAGIQFSFMKLKYLIIAIRKAKSIVGNLTSFNLINYWASNADNLIIGKVYGAASLGIYDRAYKLLNMAIGMITSLFGKILMPSLKELSNKGGDVNKEYMNTLGLISLINYPISVVFILFAKPLVIFLWSATWVQVADLLPYIGVLILVRTLNSTTGNIFILYNKEKTLNLIGIPTNIIIVSAIALGAVFSMVHVLRFYALAFVGIDIPFVMYYGFKKSFGFQSKTILTFWLPKILICLLLIFAIWFKMKPGIYILLILYLIHLIIDQKNDIASSLKLIQRKLKNQR